MMRFKTCLFFPRKPFVYPQFGDEAHRRSMSSFGAIKNLRLHVNQKSNEVKKDLPAFQPQNLNYSTGKVNENQKIVSETKPFSLIQSTGIDSNLHMGDSKLSQMDNNLTSSAVQKRKNNNLKSSYLRLQPGMGLLKNYISLNDQVEIVNICQEFGVGRGGFYQPCNANGSKLRLQMMCFGRNWDPITKYKARVRSDGSEAPPLPDKLISLALAALEDSHACLKDGIPTMYPDICIVNFYETTGRLGLHQDRDESYNSLKRGLPVVSISIGDVGEFLYGHARDKTQRVWLESGDVLIFGGKSRLVFHGVKTIIPDSAPLPLLKETMLRPGRLNLTFRQF